MIIKTNETVLTALKELLGNEQDDSLSESLHLSLPLAYRKLLGPLRFDYMSMLDPDNKEDIQLYKHFHKADIKVCPTPTQTKIVRLA